MSCSDNMGPYNSNLAPLPLLIIAAATAITMIPHSSDAQNSKQDILNAHNTARAAVGVGPVTWNNTVAAYARNYAERRRADCRLIHSDGPYGENIFWGSGASFTAVDAVEDWVAEKQFYDYHSNACADGEQCGHYTQVVWRDSVRVGCARAVCDNADIFITCNYDPPGNIEGEWPY